MAATRRMLPDLTALDADALRTLILAQQEELASRDTEIENLKLLVLKLKRLQFGQKSEKLDKQIEQLELRLEDLEANQAARPPSASTTAQPVSKPVRRPLPEHLPREIETYVPQHQCCPDCGGSLRLLGEDVSEILEYVPARFKVIRQVRPKLSCSGCERIVQEPAPSRPIERGLAGPAPRVDGAASPRPDQRYSRMFWYRSMRTIFLCIDKQRSTSAREWNWNVRRWLIGLVERAACLPH